MHHGRVTLLPSTKEQEVATIAFHQRAKWDSIQDDESKFQEDLALDDKPPLNCSSTRTSSLIDFISYTSETSICTNGSTREA